MKEKREEWAKKLWEKAREGWTARTDDLKYRANVSRPALKEEISKIESEKGVCIIEFGCGDGTETLELANYLNEKNITGEIIAYDPQSQLLEKTKNENKKIGKIQIRFETGDFEKFKEQITPSDILFSIYVLNDVADAQEYLLQTKELLKKGGKAIFQFVHPAFVEAMIKKKVAKLESSLSDIQTMTVQYPILEKQNYFYLPVFNRKEQTYKSLLEEIGFEIESIKELIPLQNSHSRKEVPIFYTSQKNIYFPEMNQIPSTMQITAHKK